MLDVAGAGPKGVNKSLLDVAGTGPRGVNKSLLDVAGVGPKGVMRFALTTTMRSAPSFAPADAADDRFKFYTYLPTLLLSY